MGGGEREGSGSACGNGNANAPSGGGHPAATPPVVANEGIGNGNARNGGGGRGIVVEKVKFTVSVRGNQWSSARHVNGTLEEFAATIEPQRVGIHHLRMSDLSACFHLNVVNAAKNLGVSLSTLKKACRKFGLKRWPGRKVRSLESTIDGLEHTIAVGQGAGLEELTEAYMRSGVRKLQQEMDQLVLGAAAQHSSSVRIEDLYKRLYSRGWRSRFHSAGRHDMITLDNGNPTKRAYGFAPPTTRKYREAAEENKQRKGTRMAVSASKEDPLVTPPQPTPALDKDRPRDTVMKDCDIVGLLRTPEVHDMHVEGNDHEAPASEI